MTSAVRSENEIKCKIIVVGDISIGKTSLISRFCKRSYNDNQITTTSLDILTRSIQVGDKKVTMSIWDTVGQEKFFSLSSGLFRHCQAVLLTYDVTRQTTLFNIDKWLKLVQEVAPSDVIIVLVGHKCDSNNKQILTEEGQMVADYYGIPFFEASAKSNINLDDIFHFIAQTTANRSTVDNLFVHQSVGVTLENPPLASSSSSSCYFCWN